MFKFLLSKAYCELKKYTYFIVLNYHLHYNEYHEAIRYDLTEY